MKNPKDATYKAKLNLPYTITSGDKDKILEILACADFEAISVDISTYRRLIDPDADDARIRAMGYIKDYDAATQEFTIIIYSKTNDIVSRFVNPVVSLIYRGSAKKGIRIMKFIIEPGPMISSDDNEEESETDE